MRMMIEVCTGSPPGVIMTVVMMMMLIARLIDEDDDRSVHWVPSRSDHDCCYDDDADCQAHR